jgi:hypothetical protein
MSASVKTCRKVNDASSSSHVEQDLAGANGCGLALLLPMPWLHARAQLQAKHVTTGSIAANRMAPFSLLEAWNRDAAGCLGVLPVDVMVILVFWLFMLEI